MIIGIAGEPPIKNSVATQHIQSNHNFYKLDFDHLAQCATKALLALTDADFVGNHYHNDLPGIDLSPSDAKSMMVEFADQKFGPGYYESVINRHLDMVRQSDNNFEGVVIPMVNSETMATHIQAEGGVIIHLDDRLVALDSDFVIPPGSTTQEAFTLCIELFMEELGYV